MKSNNTLVVHSVYLCQLQGLTEVPSRYDERNQYIDSLKICYNSIENELTTFQ